MVEEKRTGLGKALRRAVGYEEVEEEKTARARSRESVLMNTTRQAIFQFLCDRPCSHLRLVARSLGISTPTADWHLKKLIRNGFVSRQMVGKKKVYFPKDFVSPQDVLTFALLNEDLPRKILLELQERPGLSQSAIKERIDKGAISRCLAQMHRAGILDTITSGRFVHYYIDKGLLTRDREYTKRMRQFRRTLMKRLNSDGLDPRILKAREKAMEVEVMAGPERKVLIVHTRPFAFMLTHIR